MAKIAELDTIMVEKGYPAFGNPDVYEGKEALVIQLESYYDKIPYAKTDNSQLNIEFYINKGTEFSSIKLPEPEKTDKNINGYFERVKNDEKYKEIKEIVTEIQKETLEKNKNKNCKELDGYITTITNSGNKVNKSVDKGDTIKILRDYYNNDKKYLDEKIQKLDVYVNLWKEVEKREINPHSTKEIQAAFSNYKFNDDEIHNVKMKLPSPETANNINEYYENMKQDEKYKDIKILITDMQKETIEFEKAEILLEQEIFNKSNTIAFYNEREHKGIHNNISENMREDKLNNLIVNYGGYDVYVGKEAVQKLENSSDEFLKGNAEIRVELSLKEDTAEKLGKKEYEVYFKDIKENYPNYQFSNDELTMSSIVLPVPEKSDKNINGYFERIKNDEKYKDMKNLISDVQKEAIRKEKINQKISLQIEHKDKVIHFDNVTIEKSEELYKDERSTVNKLEIENNGKKFEVKETLVDDKVIKLEFAKSVKKVSQEKLGKFDTREKVKEKTKFQRLASKFKGKSKGIDR